MPRGSMPTRVEAARPARRLLFFPPHRLSQSVEAEWAAGTFASRAGDEDIHTANERRLGELVGPVAGKVAGRERVSVATPLTVCESVAHRAFAQRSRWVYVCLRTLDSFDNAQVATDLKLWLRDHMDLLANESALLIETLAARCKKDAQSIFVFALIHFTRAEAEVEHLMPGYTHLQRAQPIRWSQWLLSHAWALARDHGRLQDARARLNECPLGAGALAGHAFGLDRARVAQQLGFARPAPNSIDATANRDFVLEFLAYATITG